MPITASLQGRLRNINLPKSSALMPLHEAVVNSIQSIDLAFAGQSSEGLVEIEIIRSPQLAISIASADGPQTEPIIEFIVRDNGEGFHDDNLESFGTLDSVYKAGKGCRGIGRLLWLKAFARVEVQSTFKVEQDRFYSRSFSFTRDEGVEGLLTHEAGAELSGAVVRLVGFEEKYRDAAPRKADSISRAILEHCLWYFVRPGGAPRICVIDDGEVTSLNDKYDEYVVSATHSESLTVGSRHFDLAHVRLKSNVRSKPQLSWCASDRIVLSDNLASSIRGLHGRLGDADGEFMYAGFIFSKYLDEHVRPERDEFNIPEKSEDVLQQEEPAMEEIRAAALEAIERNLVDSLTEVRESGLERIQKYVDSRAPRYRPVLSYIGDKVDLNPSLSDRELELQLHRGLAEMERDLIDEGHQVLDPNAIRDEDYDRRVQEYLARVGDIKQSDLAAYVSWRRVVLDLLQRAINSDANGRYSREDEVHNLIMQMRTTSDDIATRSSNLWIIDERLAFHEYLASDKPISAMPITGSNSGKEPDLVMLKVTDNPLLVAEGSGPPFATITIIEIKRPMRKDISAGEEKDPIEQALGYLERIRVGGVLTAAGRPIPKSENVPGFIYVLADLTENMERRCRQHDLKPTQDGMGYFGYHQTYRTYIEVMSFDRLLNAANERNRAFFSALGLPAN